MIVYVTPANRARYRNELNQYYRLRHRIFCEKLGWVPSRPDCREMDRFDSHFNIYILCLDEETGQLAGGVRLMPTTGPTLLNTVWRDMLPSETHYRSPNIWEATRFCVDEEISSRKKNLLNRTTLMLSIAVADFGNANGITHVIAVCEHYFFNMSGAYGPKADIISTKTDENGLEISCGIWSTESIQSRLTWSRAIIGNVDPILVKEVA